MKGVVIAAALILAQLLCCSTVLANPPLVPPVQYEQFCEAQKVSGTGLIDVSTSIVDKRLALEYYNNMAGDGDLELDQEHAYSQNSDKLQRNISSVNGGDKSQLNLYESTKMTYSSPDTTLEGVKFLQSKSFYGGIGAKLQESFSVYEMEKDEKSFFVSTTPYNPKVTEKKPAVSTDYLQLLAMYYPQEYAAYMAEKTHTITPEQLILQLKDAGRDTDRVAELMGSNPAHLIGIETKNSFNGTWGTDASWHKIFYKDIKSHEMFSGVFEAEKTLKFHENPVPEVVTLPCDGIDC
ncbi:MAG TPA: hypothetical protein PLQ01_09330 [Methanothrix sp.]|jgi:hypothetical protein|nr:hypothetical protein [Methanothrix sp.]HOV82859.1 hypothetical protein [Methanothrix sp.]HPC89665.1 hypothetical protein [Methanothrix sp.]HQI67993.1 hypothetical protein [Methanothrix sp.]HRS84921.1 hypothetical protein [Methanothrix sp.]